MPRGSVGERVVEELATQAKEEVRLAQRGNLCVFQRENMFNSAYLSRRKRSRIWRQEDNGVKLVRARGEGVVGRRNIGEMNLVERQAEKRYR